MERWSRDTTACLAFVLSSVSYYFSTQSTLPLTPWERTHKKKQNRTLKKRTLSRALGYSNRSQLCQLPWLTAFNVRCNQSVPCRISDFSVITVGIEFGRVQDVSTGFKINFMPFLLHLEFSIHSTSP